jgi:diadenosine tetraphosphatase ApaH/serine/threonine PP2A family protein phosphatase
MTNPVWAGIHHAVRQLDSADFDWLEALPRILEIPGAIIAHAALHDRHAWPYLLNDDDARDTLGILKDSGIDIGFFGHTHRQDFFLLPGTPSMVTDEVGFTVPDGAICAVVVGSVGQPRTADPRAGWTLWDSDARRFEFRRTAYPIEETARAIHQAGLPASSARRLSGGA